MSTDNDTFRRGGPLRALLWKEWRRQRLIFALMLPLPLLVLALAPSRVFAEATLIALVLWAGLPALLGANAFAGEEEDQSADFARSLPLPSRTIFWPRLGLVWVLSVVAAVPWLVVFRGAAAAADVGASRDWSFYGVLGGLFRILRSAATGSPGDLAPLSLLFVVAAAVYAFTAAWAAYTTASVLATAVGALMGGTLLIVWWQAFLNAAATISVGSPIASALLDIAVLAVLVLLTAGLRPPRAQALRRRLMRSVLFAVVCLALVPLPSLLVYLRFVCLSVPRDYLGGEASVWVAPSPSGDHMALEFQFENPSGSGKGWGSGGGSRVGVTSLSTGESQWIGPKTRSSYLMPARWSPTGDRLLFLRTGRPLLPSAWQFPSRLRQFMARRWSSARQDWCIYDVTAQTFEPILQYLRPGAVTCWYDNDTVAGGAPRAVGFLDLRSGAVAFCEFPDEWPKHHTESQHAYWRHRDGHWAVTDRGLFGPYCLIRGEGSAGGYTAFAMLRTAPELPEGEAIRVPHRSRRKADPLAVSNDGCWLAYSQDAWDAGRRPIWLASLLDGTTHELRPQVDQDYGGNPQFLPDSSALVYLLRAGVALCDVRTRDWRALPIDGLDPRPRERRYSIGRLWISPDGQHVAVLLHLSADERWLGIIDLQTGTNWELPLGAEKACKVHWLGTEKLLVLLELGPYVTMNLDGSGRRMLGEE